MSGDIVLHVSNKLAGEWSAGSVTGMLSPAVVEYLTTEKKWDALDPLIKARLLLSPLFLRLKELHELEEPLKKLKLAGTADRDEWVRVMAAAVGPYDGRLHMDDVIKESKVVKTTLEDVRRLAADADPSLFRPLEELYLSRAVLDLRLPQNATDTSTAPPIMHHFVPRDPSTAPKATDALPGGSSRPHTHSAPATTTAAPASSAPPRVPDESGPRLPPRAVPPGPSGVGGVPRPPRRPLLQEDSGLFVSRKPVGGGGGVSRPIGAGLKFPVKKKAALIDVQAVAQLNAQAQAEKERLAKEEEAAKEAAAKAKAEARAAEKMKKEEERLAAKAAKAAKAAEMQAAKEAALAKKAEEKAQKEAEAQAAKEAAAQKKEEERAQKEAERARKELERAAKEAHRAAKVEKKRSAEQEAGDGPSARPPRPPKAPKVAKAPKDSAGGDDGGIGWGELGGDSDMVPLDPAAASAALEKAALIADVEAAGISIDPDLMQYLQYAPDSDGGGGG